MRILWGIFTATLGLVGMAAGMIYAWWLGEAPPASLILIIGGAVLIVLPIFRWILTDTTTKKNTYPRTSTRGKTLPATMERYGAFNIKTAPGPRDWTPPTTD